MMPKPHEPREPTNRSAAPTPNWATAATEARRRRDDAVKQKIEERRQQRRQARAAVDDWFVRELPDQESLMQVLNARALKRTIVHDPAEIA
jgi:hypothetical protein